MVPDRSPSPLRLPGRRSPIRPQRRLRRDRNGGLPILEFVLSMPGNATSLAYGIHGCGCPGFKTLCGTVHFKVYHSPALGWAMMHQMNYVSRWLRMISRWPRTGNRELRCRHRDAGSTSSAVDADLTLDVSGLVHTAVAR